MGSWQAPTFTRRPELPFEAAAARQRGPFWCTSLLLAGMCVYLACWSARPLNAGPDTSAGIILQADVSSSKLNTTSAAAFAPIRAALPSEPGKQQYTVRKPEPLELAAVIVPPVKHETEPPKAASIKQVASPEPPLPPMAAVKVESGAVVPPVQPVVLDEIVPVAPGPAELTSAYSLAQPAMHEGDPPMTRNWKMFGLQTLLAAALTATPALATSGPEGDGKNNNEKPNKTLEERIKKIEDDVKDFKTDFSNKVVAAVKAALENKDTLKSLTGKIAAAVSTALDQEIDKKVAEAVKAALDVEMRGELNKLKDEVKRLQDLVKDSKVSNSKTTEARAFDVGMEEIRKALDDIKQILLKPRIAFSRPAPNNGGRIVLTNNYGEDVTFILNNREVFRLAPGQSRVLEGQPAGTFTYEILSPTWGSRGRTTSTILSNETVRLNVD
jgi:hypothetical protein